MSTERKLSVTITGPEGMLGAMATLLRDEGYTVVAPGENAEADAIIRAGGLIEAQLQKRRAAEQAVLDAMAVSAIAVYRDGRRGFLHDEQEQAVCVAELARREARP